MMSFWSAVQTSGLAEWINYSRWLYAGVSTLHVLSIGTLIGSIVLLDLRLIGVAKWLDTEQLARLAVPVAGIALCAALVSGALLFIGRATEYAAFSTFQIKIALIVAALSVTFLLRRRYGVRFERANDSQCRQAGILSLVLWIGVAVAGRMIAFVHG